MTTQVKAIEQYFPILMLVSLTIHISCVVVFFVALYKLVLAFESVNEILMSDHTNESD